MLRWLRSIWHMFTGIFGNAADKLQTNPNVMAATYDASIAKQAQRFDTVQKAVADQMGLKLKRVQEVKELGDKIKKLTLIQQGAAARAKTLTEQLKAKGQTIEQIKTNPDFIKHMAAYQDASSSLKDAESAIKEKEDDLAARTGQIAKYQAELQSMQRKVAALKDEKSMSIAETTIATQQEAVNKVLAGIADDTTDKDLQAAREARDRSKARSTIMADLIGNDATVAESEYLKYASDTTAADEFSKLVGLDDGKVDEPSVAPLAEAKLPE